MKNKHILLILVGGTICTALNEEGNLSVNEKAGSHLVSAFENSSSPYAKQVSFDLTENLYILSENMTVEKWNLMLDTYLSHTKNTHYDGIIFAHGTDTLAYSASLFAQLLSATDVPVFFVSANKNLSDAASNGHANFRCAVECICRNITPNVYVSYRNISDGKMYLHLGSRLQQCPNYSEDFQSAGMLDISDISEQNFTSYFERIQILYPPKKRNPFVTETVKLKPCVLLLTPYVGIRYDAYHYEKFDAVLHGTFHSGTACAEGEVNSVLDMLDRCAELHVDAYLSPALLKKGTYETVSIIGNHEKNGQKFKFLYGFTQETAYAKLLIAYSCLLDATDRQTFIETEHNFEITDRKETAES